MSRAVRRASTRRTTATVDAPGIGGVDVAARPRHDEVMIEMIENAPDGVLGFRAVGEVTASDYESVLDPAIDRTLQSQEKVNLVIVLGDRFERYSLGAMWQDTMLSGKPHRVWGRCALVTGHSVIAEIIHSLAFLFPGDLRFFPLDQEHAALAWAAGGDDTGS